MISEPVRQGLEFACKAFLNTAFLAALVAGAVRLRAHSSEAPEHRVDLGRWALLRAPDWAGAQDAMAVRRAAGLGKSSLSLLRSGDLAELEDRLEAAPTVKRVAGLCRVLPNRVRVGLELRRPVAVVAVPRSGYAEVDAEGTVLTVPAAARPARRHPLRVIEGVAGVPVPGRPAGAEVAAAADLVRRLDAADRAVPAASTAFLDRVTISPRAAGDAAGDPRYTLAAPSGALVEWGRIGAHQESTGEPSFDAKLARLRRALELFPGLEGVSVVKVAFEDLIVVPPKPAPSDRRSAASGPR